MIDYMDHRYLPTRYTCVCGGPFLRAAGTNFLVCGTCSEPGWLV